MRISWSVVVLMLLMCPEELQMELSVVDMKVVREMEEIVEVVIQTKVAIKTKVVNEVEEVAMADMKMMMEVVIEGGIVIMKVEEEKHWFGPEKKLKK